MAGPAPRSGAQTNPTILPRQPQPYQPQSPGTVAPARPRPFRPAAGTTPNPAPGRSEIVPGSARSRVQQVDASNLPQPASHEQEQGNPRSAPGRTEPLRPRETLQDPPAGAAGAADLRSPSRPGTPGFDSPPRSRATFRGPQAEKRVTTLPKQQQQAVSDRLREQVRTWNQSAPQNGHLIRDVVGNQIPSGRSLYPARNDPHINAAFTRLERRLGGPTNYFSFLPRGPHDYWKGYWDGYQNDGWNGRGHCPHPAVVLNFYYGYYWSDPTWFGFSYPGYYSAVYQYYGYCPSWIYPTRVYVNPTEYVYQPPDIYRYYNGTRVDTAGAAQAIQDVTQAWQNNDVDLLSRHLTDQLDIQVSFDGKYEYTTSTQDYYGMTADAFSTTQTESLDFDDPIFITSREVFYTGRHQFVDPDGNHQVVYVSYRLRKLGADWYIVAVGTSLDPIQCPYQDFRAH